MTLAQFRVAPAAASAKPSETGRRLLRSWAFRVVVIYTALFAVSVVALLGFVYATTLSYLDSQINATILEEINGLNDNYRDEGVSGLTDAVTSRLASDRGGDGVYLLTDSAYRPVAGNLQAWPEILSREERWVSFDITSELAKAPLLPGRARGISFRLSEGYHLLVGRNLRERENFGSLILQSMVWALAATLGLALIGGFVMSRDMRRRLDTINRTTERIVHGDLTRRVPLTGSGDEFDQLSSNLNEMLAQIDRLMGAMREVSDNIAHDLRSPLTRLKSRLELTLLEDGGAEQYRRAIESAVRETDQVLGTFNALLSIAQAEAGTVRGEMTEIDLATLCADVAELYEPVAEAKGLAFDAKLEPVGQLRGNRHLLFQAVVNLVDNAIKYTPPGGSVRLVTRPLAEMAEIEISDSGPGVPEADRERVLQRFVRLESSRTTPGNGLGLSLVSAVMALHQGSIAFADNAPGLKAVLRLPVQVPTPLKLAS